MSTSKCITGADLVKELQAQKTPFTFGEEFRIAIKSGLEKLLDVSRDALSDTLTAKFDKEVKRFYDYVPSCLRKTKNKDRMLSRFAVFFNEKIELKEDEPVQVRMFPTIFSYIMSVGL